MKKILLIIALLISALGLNAQSVTIGDLKFTVTFETSAECEVSGYSGEPVNVIIPSKVTISGKEYTVTSIGDYAFSWCSSLTSIEIPSGVTEIDNSAFNNCTSLTSIEIPSRVTSIGSSAFFYCSSLTSVTFGENSQLTSIGERAFSGCSSLTSVTFGENSKLTSIGEWAFEHCSSLTSVTFGENSKLTSIGEGAFEYCSSLTSIELPSGVTSIGSSAFFYCFNLTSISCHAESVPETDPSAFRTCNLKMVIYVPEQSVDAYKAASPWNEYTILAMPNYEIVAVIAPSESGVVNGAGTYNHGEDVTLTATANEGYKFINWTENGEVVSEEAEYSFEITNDRNLVANFELLSYNVTASVNPENAGVVTGSGTYNHGEDVTLTATANEGHKFVNWTENDVIVSTENEYSFIVTKDINLVSNFEKTTCNVTVVVNPEEAGTVTGAGTYVKNMSVTLVATANTGYKFVNWTENGTIVSTEREYSFVVSLDTDLVANFVSTEGVEELASSFNIYPNPVSDKLYIETLTLTQTVEIYDVYGRLQVTETPSHQDNLSIDVTSLNSGVYFVKIVTSEGEAVKRFIKD